MRLLVLLILTQSLIGLAGCDGRSTTTAEPNSKPPKPVSTMVLRRSSPSYQHHTTASVAAWKSEQIGFEQAGRVVQVIEPNEMVTGRGIQNAGVPLARLDDEQFRIAVDAAKADAAVAERRRDSNLIAIEQRLPTAVKTAEAEQTLAETEFDRIERLVNSDALSKSEFDTARTRASTAQLRVASVKAELAQANAEHLALDAQVQQAAQRLAEAERNLKNTVLFSSFPGQVVEVHAVPGTYVKEGDPIVTVQMVDPMLVEFEVTAANSRRYQRSDSLGVSVETPDGQRRVLTGMVYTVDSIADNNTRTFTVSLHVRNERENAMREIGSSENIVTTDMVFPLNLGPIVTGDQRLLVERSAVHRIDGEDFVWKITNRSWNKLTDSDNRELAVERLKVNITSDIIPFLGTWNFLAIEFDDPSGVDLEQDLITGKLTFDRHDSSPPVGLGDWSGDRVLLEQTQWMLRAGDTVGVATIPESPVEGFYVPMKAVRRENGQTFIHVVDASDSDVIARRVFVKVTSDDSVAEESLMLCVEPANAGESWEEMQVVVGGTHYLNDGDHVRVVPQQRVSDGGR